MYSIKITSTAKGYAPKDEWSTFDVSRHFFDTLDEAREFVRDRYAGKRGRPIYMDTKSRGTIQCGYIFSSREEDQDRSAADGVYRYMRQDWVSFERVISHPTENRKGEVESVDVKARATRVAA